MAKVAVIQVLEEATGPMTIREITAKAELKDDSVFYFDVIKAFDECAYLTRKRSGANELEHILRHKVSVDGLREENWCVLKDAIAEVRTLKAG